MIELETARALVEAYLDERLRPEMAGPIVISFSAVTTAEFVFFYQSLSYLQTGIFNRQLAGNGPLIVDRETGHLTQGGTALSWQQQVKGEVLESQAYDFGLPSEPDI